jgi:hypothetical protein
MFRSKKTIPMRAARRSWTDGNDGTSQTVISE